MKFGVDQNGVLVPFLRRGRSEALQLSGSPKTIPVRPKVSPRH
jgi:hypothetical protein